MSSVVSKTSSSVQVRTCAYCKQTGHFLRATRDPASAITCPVLKEKEKKVRDEKRKISVKSKPLASSDSYVMKPTNLFGAFSKETDSDSDSDDKEPNSTLHRNTSMYQFPTLPTIQTVNTIKPSEGSVFTPSKKSYASVATHSSGSVEQTPNVKPVMKTPNAPMKPTAPTKVIYHYPQLTRQEWFKMSRKSWVDYLDEEDEEDDDEEIPTMPSLEEYSWKTVTRQGIITTGHMYD